MRKKEYPDVHAGQVWVDRDVRMGDRRVRVVGAANDGDTVFVLYRNVAGLSETPVGRTFRSQYGRFQRAFDLLDVIAEGRAR